jgi:hypothetical protein
METIFGSSMATARYALGSSEPLTVNHVDSVTAKRAMASSLLLMSKLALRLVRAARLLTC